MAIPATSEEVSKDAVSLLGLDKLSNINALADDQPVPFAPTGITILFGDNGSGKTGFGRLLRTLCWARKRPDGILPNIDVKDDRPQQATVLYRTGSTDHPAYTWHAGDTPPPELSRISVYDIDCGAVYINEEQQAAYAPFGLDYFPKLAEVCDAVRDQIKSELEQLEGSLEVWPEAITGTSLGPILSALPDAEAKTQLESVRPLGAAEEEGMRSLAKALQALQRDDPKKRIPILRNLAQRHRAQIAFLNGIEAGLSDNSVESYKGALFLASTKAKAAKLASDKALGQGVLPGTGGPVWEELWNAARKFSETVAYPDRMFPVCDHDDRCVLCQQELTPDASNRLKSFDEFVKDEAATQAQKAAAEVENQHLAFKGITCARPDLESVKQEMELSKHGLGEIYAAHLLSAARRRRYILDASDQSDWTTLPPLSESPAGDLDALAKDADAQAKTIEEASGDKERDKKERELAELSARKWLSENRALVASEIKKQQLAGVLRELAETATSTTKITTTGNKLTEKHVTKAHQERFTQELRSLRVGHLGVELSVKRGVKGSSFHQLIFTRAPGHTLASVLSSGERNVVGLAAFFAELSPESKDGIILDDPVSSLDQDRRDEVAARLVDEAERRQVIVWTHDLSFLGALKDGCDSRKRTLRVLTISNLNGTAGIVDESLPWLVMKVNDRIKRLAVEIESMRKSSAAKQVDEYTAKGRLFYGRLRDSWERATEEVLFQDVVQRWRRSVKTTMLRNVADNVTGADCKLIESAMTHCSKYAHDQQAATPTPIPRIEDVETDLKQLRDWVATKRAVPVKAGT